MTDMKVTASLLIDGVDAARELESALDEYLEPLPPAAYLPGQAEPVFTMGQHYYQYVDGKQDWVNRLEDIRSDVYQGRDELVFEAQHLGRLMAQPDLPVRGLRVVRELIEVMLRRHARWTRKRSRNLDSVEAGVFASLRDSSPRISAAEVAGVAMRHHEGVENKLVDPQLLGVGTSIRKADQVLWDQEEARKRNQHAPMLGAILHDFLRPEFRYVRNPERLVMNNLTGMAEPAIEVNLELREKLSVHLMDLRGQIAKFLGDDNWIMHFLEEVGNDFVIRKTIDYRIWSWEREHGDEYE